MNNPQLDDLRDAAASAIFNAFDMYGWPLLVTLLAALFLGAILLLSFCMEFELDIGNEGVEGVFEICRFVRNCWRNRTK